MHNGELLRIDLRRALEEAQRRKRLMVRRVLVEADFIGVRRHGACLVARGGKGVDPTLPSVRQSGKVGGGARSLL